MDTNLLTIKTDVMAAIDSIAQGRSNYAIQHFVVGQHDTSERQYQQCLIELNAKLNNIKRDEINLKKKLKAIASETDEDEKALLEIDAEEMAFNLKSQQREAGTLYMIFKTYPKYSYQQLQEAEAKYWQLRLTRQAELDVFQRQSGIGSGNAEALRQAGILGGFSETFINKTLPGVTTPQIQ